MRGELYDKLCSGYFLAMGSEMGKVERSYEAKIAMVKKLRKMDVSKERTVGAIRLKIAEI